MTTQVRVLDLSYNRQLKCLPNSISDLENLCGLFLGYCQSISCLPALEKLSALRVLDISGCSKISCLAAIKKLRALRVLNIEDCKGIRKLPQDMECLASLQYLYTMHTSILEIPKVVISKLRNLRCLQLEECGSLQSEEVNWLPHLQEFTNCYDELHSFNTLVKKLEQLECYHICVGGRNYRELDTKSKTVYLEGIGFKGERGQEIKALLPANICCLHINRCEALNGSIADYFQSVMSNLRKLEVHDCKEVEWISNSKQITENAAFKSLEVLDLSLLPKLISVCKGEDVILPDYYTFSCLKHVHIFECKSMKKLLPLALLQNLKSLETLYVARCYQLEVVIGEVEGDEEGIGSSSNSPLLSSSNILYLPNLKSLQLDNLPALKSICNGRGMICPSIEKILIWRCTNIKRMPSFLPINEAIGQPYLPSSFRGIYLFPNKKEWWESLEWHNPNAKDILQSHIHW
ncbi:PREDICTED: disease resistance protein At4g27190-like isoform X3 [Ipomoea nil]|nr:PREDICTED: disease resistance protein At4g27190-like isoform X2 [Ipomoea nil]XP_019177585.1 PREDICTED: disease resistance protein At4g27190-like isoform X3 [Ipomoea nil]